MLYLKWGTYEVSCPLPFVARTTNFVFYWVCEIGELIDCTFCTLTKPTEKEGCGLSRCEQARPASAPVLGLPITSPAAASSHTPWPALGQRAPHCPVKSGGWVFLNPWVCFALEKQITTSKLGSSSVRCVLIDICK